MGKTDIAGQRFGRLTALHRVPEKTKNSRWLCRCDCGAETTPFLNSLRRGLTTSCGCLGIEARQARRTHGQTVGGRPTLEYGIWSSMKSRCKNPNNPAFKDYGARGISVCERWDQSVEAFIADMGPRPSGHTVERLDNDGDYSPENCVWLPRAEQAHNQRRTHWVEFCGQRYSLTRYAEVRGVRTAALSARVRRGQEVHAAADALSAKGG